MNWFFEPRRDQDGGRHDHDGSAPGLISLPTALLQRHGALVLDPGDAAEIRGRPAPRSTVYRARTLLVAGDLLEPKTSKAVFDAINKVLGRVGMQLIPPRTDGYGGHGEEPGGGILRAFLARARHGRGKEPGGGILRRLARPAILVPAKPADGMAALPVVVDAWVALQALRAAAASPEHPALDEKVVSGITLEHLLISSAITGTGAHGHGGGLTGDPDDSSGVTGPSSTDSYLYSGGDTRAPVAVSLEAPRRKSALQCESHYGRRPVLAVLDTGVREHPWLDVRADHTGGYITVPDGFVAVDPDMQHAIYEEGRLAEDAGDRPRQLIRHPWDRPITADPLIGELDTDTGHCTFIAGIVRQVAPDAQVLAIRIMHSDGVVYEGDLILALGLLAERVAAAEAGDLAAMVDVVSLSLGYFSESAADEAFSSGLRQVIDELLGMGVAVVAAAGNYATSREFYPAAFTEQPSPGPVPLISVGALNPNGSQALFSDGGHWITAWATGAAMVSTFPVDINGSRTPQIRMRARPANGAPAGVPPSREREALDPDDYSGGFAVWSGTSFSAPLLAAHIARSLLEGAADPALRLDRGGQQAAAGRAVAALRKLGWRG